MAQEQTRFDGLDNDGERTLSFPGIALMSQPTFTDFVPSTRTHDPPSTSPTSAGPHEVFPSPMDGHYEAPESSSHEFVLLGVGASNNDDSTTFQDTIDPQHLQLQTHMPTINDQFPDPLEEGRIRAVLTWWGAGNYHTRSGYSDALFCLKSWLDEQLRSARPQGWEQPRDVMQPVPPQPQQGQQQTSRQRFFCCQCSRGKDYGSRGTIERHLKEKHTRHEFYVCDYCSVITFRRDKVKTHYQTHFFNGSLTQDEISMRKRTTRRPAPRRCIICHKGVNGWDGLMNCLVEHCRHHRQSDNSSGSSVPYQDNSGDDGSSRGFGSGQGNPPGPADGGSGLSQQGGFNQLLGMNPSPGQNYGSYRNFSCSSGEEHSGDASPLESKLEVPDDSNPPPMAESAIDGDKAKLESHSDVMDSDVLRRLIGSKDQELKKPHQNKQDTKCNQCGHVVGSCSNCPEEVKTTVGCHKCNQDRQAQPQHRLSHCLTASATSAKCKDITYNGLSGGVSKRLCIRPAMKTIGRIRTALDLCNHINRDQQHLYQPQMQLMCSSTEIVSIAKSDSSIHGYTVLGDDNSRTFYQELGRKSLTYPMITCHHANCDQLASLFYSWNIGTRQPSILSEQHLFSLRQAQIGGHCVKVGFSDWTEDQLEPSRLGLSNYELFGRTEFTESVDLSRCIGSCMQQVRLVKFANGHLLYSMIGCDETSLEIIDFRKVFSHYLLLLERIWMSLHTPNYDVTIRAQNTLELIRIDPPTTVLSSIKHLQCCRTSIDAINAELDETTVDDTVSESEMNPPEDRHKRLSALRTRLRVVAMLLMLQTTVTSMRQRSTVAENGSFECSLDRKSMARFHSTQTLGGIVPYTVIQLLESLSCRIKHAWKHIHHLDIVSFVVDPDEELTPIIIILSILIMKLCDFASCPMGTVSIIANNNADILNIGATQQETETDLLGASGLNELLQNGILMSGCAMRTTFQTAIEHPEHSLGTTRLAAVAHDVDFSINGDSKQQILEVIRQAIEDGWQTASDEYM